LFSDTNKTIQFEADNLVWKADLIGKGPKLLIAFHGYGQNADIFRHVEELMQEEYTFLLVDLAFHRHQKDFPKGFLFDEAYSKKWISAILEKSGKTVVSLMGFSIGARIAMFVAQNNTDKVNEIWLIAPDGLPVSKAYKFLTRSWFGKKLFQHFVESPSVANLLIAMGEKSKLITVKAAKFYRHEISNVSMRQQLFDTWVSYQEAIPNYKVLGALNDKGKLAITCILGKQDAIIKFRRTRKFLRKSLPDAQIIELEIGHNILSDKGVKKLFEYWKA
jgi:pimeloyl-ACP methyl ester carboxylesterase